MFDLDCKSKIRLNYGWSHDSKYILRDSQGNKYLLRQSDISKFDHVKKEYELVQLLFNSGVNVPEPITSYISEDGQTYDRIYRWIEGEMLQNVIYSINPELHYTLGLEAGKLLSKIHTVDFHGESYDWDSYFQRKIQKKIDAYHSCGIHFEQDEVLLSWIKESDHLLCNRPIVYQHGDFHVGNMILSKTNRLTSIDFDRHDTGDPFEEFNRIAMSASISPLFASGQINAYFKGLVPSNFFQLLRLYFAVNAIGSIPWAISYGDAEVESMIEQARTILSWYPDSDNFEPNWYSKP